ncbi:hypothetical protein BH23PLA1_BH23PLA1_31540 [soil metagenome]
MNKILQFGIAIAASMVLVAAVLLSAQHSEARQEDAGAQARREIGMLLKGDIEADTDAIVRDLPALNELAEQRQQVAERLMDLALREFLAPPSPSAARGTFAAAVNDYLNWSKHRMEARLELAEADQDGIDIVAQEIAKLRKVEEIYTDLSRAAGASVTPKNLLELQAHHLDLETRLARLVAN